jgi:hypothetical protein
MTVTLNSTATVTDDNLWFISKAIDANVTMTNFKLEIGDIKTDFTKAPEDLQKDLLDTGIDITNNKITFTANTDKFVNNSGDTIAVFNSDGTINANIIDVDSLVTRVFKCFNKNGELLTAINNEGDGAFRTYYSNYASQTEVYA